MNDEMYNFPPLEFEEGTPDAGRPIFDDDLYRGLFAAGDIPQMNAYMERYEVAQEAWEDTLQAKRDAADALLPAEELAQLKLDRAWGSFNFMLRMQSGFGMSREHAESLLEVQANDPLLQQDRITQLIENIIAKSEPASVLDERWKAYNAKMAQQNES
jgi:hypothetical protein